VKKLVFVFIPCLVLFGCFHNDDDIDGVELDFVIEGSGSTGIERKQYVLLRNDTDLTDLWNDSDQGFLDQGLLPGDLPSIPVVDFSSNDVVALYFGWISVCTFPSIDSVLEFDDKISVRIVFPEPEPGTACPAALSTYYILASFHNTNTTFSPTFKKIEFILL